MPVCVYFVLLNFITSLFLIAEELKSSIDILTRSAANDSNDDSANNSLDRSRFEEEIAQIISTVDKNKDNMIQFDEFLEILAPQVYDIFRGSDFSKRDTSVNPLSGPLIQVTLPNEQEEEDDNKNTKYETTKLLNDRRDSGLNISGNFTDSIEPSNITSNNTSNNTPMNLTDLSTQELFNIYDQNKDGWIEKPEVRKIMNYMCIEVSDSDLDAMFFGKDKINFQNFMEIYDDLQEKWELYHNDPECQKSGLNLNSISGYASETNNSDLVEDFVDTNKSTTNANVSNSSESFEVNIIKAENARPGTVLGQKETAVNVKNENTKKKVKKTKKSSCSLM